MENTTITTETIVKPTNCDIHGCILYACTACELQVCTQCVYVNKDALTHLKDHYDTIVGLVDNNSKYLEKLNDYEGFELLNKSYNEYLTKCDDLVDSTYEKLYASRDVIIRSVKQSLLSTYLRLTETFEKTVKEVNSKISGLNVSDTNAKEDFKRVKKSMDDQTEFLDSEEKLKEEFIKIVNGAIRRVNRLKVPELAKDDFKFTIGKSGESLDLVGLSGSIIESATGKGGSYWTVKSEETFTGEFTAKVKVINIDPTKVKNTWGFTIGICRHNSVVVDTYYNDSVVLQGNGYLANKFSSTGTYKKLFDTPWQNGDEIIVRRDKLNAIYFGVNDEKDMRKAFDGVTGEFRLVIGMTTSTSGDVFEVIQIDK